MTTTVKADPFKISQLRNKVNSNRIVFGETNTMYINAKKELDDMINGTQTVTGTKLDLNAYSAA